MNKKGYLRHGKVLYSCRILYSLMVPILVRYVCAELNDIVHTQYFLAWIDTDKLSNFENHKYSSFLGDCSYASYML